MRRFGILMLLFLASCIASLPAMGMWCWRQHIIAAWEELLEDVRVLQSKRDRDQRVATQNARWKATRQEANFIDWKARGEQLVFLNKEREALDQLPIITWAGSSREVKDRKAFLQGNRLSWEEQEIGGNSKLFSFQKRIQIDGEDILLLLRLFDVKNPYTPIVFPSYWEMTRQTSSLGKEVWVVHAEVWGRCL